MSKEFLSPTHFLKFLILNVDNGKMNPVTFRTFVKDTMETVVGFEEAKAELEANGRIPGKDPDVVHPTGSQNFQDQLAESQSEWLGLKKYPKSK